MKYCKVARYHKVVLLGMFRSSLFVLHQLMQPCYLIWQKFPGFGSGSGSFPNLMGFVPSTTSPTDRQTDTHTNTLTDRQIQTKPKITSLVEVKIPNEVCHYVQYSHVTKDLKVCLVNFPTRLQHGL
jgi:hypothetical protein